MTALPQRMLASCSLMYVYTTAVAMWGASRATSRVEIGRLYFTWAISSIANISLSSSFCRGETDNFSVGRDGDVAYWGFGRVAIDILKLR